jgi:hypothetical protein
MYTSSGAPERARWEVLWINPHTKKIERKPFGADHSGAVKLYARVVKAGRKGVTLRCMNMGFPPPDQYADREEVIIKLPGGKAQKGKRMITPQVYLQRMGALNLRGIWWCPFCCELRKFVYRKGFRLDGRFVAKPMMCCPICHISQENWHVKRYNPSATLMEYRDGTIKSPSSQTAASQRRRERRAARKAKLAKEGK